MRRLLASLCLLLGSGLAFSASGECIANAAGKMVCPPPDGQCIHNRYRDVVCSPSGGGIALDRYQEPVCGAGACARDLRGDLYCSRTPRGSAAIDIGGQAACTDGCAAASAAMCVKPPPQN